jgi:hypothetical protein
VLTEFGVTCAAAGSRLRTTTTIQATRGPDLMIADFKMKSIPRIVWVVPALLLLIAVWRLTYGYYTFTRIVTCAVAVLIAFAGTQERPVVQTWSFFLLAVAVLFNPFVPIHFNRATWFIFDLWAAATFLLHLFFVRQQLT